jgi:hypothetical protein
MAAQLYQNLILYPKATSQLAKTVLGPVTHITKFYECFYVCSSKWYYAFC